VLPSDTPRSSTLTAQTGVSAYAGGSNPFVKWDAQAYLEANPDVAAAVERGEFDSAFHHYKLFGQFEGRAIDGTTRGAQQSAFENPAFGQGPVADNTVQIVDWYAPGGATVRNYTYDPALLQFEPGFGGEDFFVSPEGYRLPASQVMGGVGYQQALVFNEIVGQYIDLPNGQRYWYQNFRPTAEALNAGAPSTVSTDEAMAFMEQNSDGRPVAPANPEYLAQVPGLASDAGQAGVVSLSSQSGYIATGPSGLNAPGRVSDTVDEVEWAETPFVSPKDTNVA
jgi:hypothetical protein